VVYVCTQYEVSYDQTFPESSLMSVALFSLLHEQRENIAIPLRMPKMTLCSPHRHL